MTKEKETKHISFGLVASWIVAAILFFWGLGNLTSGVWVSGLSLMVGSFFMTPYFDKAISKKKKYKISFWAKIVLVPLGVLVLMGIFHGFVGNVDSVEEIYETPNTKTIQEQSQTYYKLGDTVNIGGFSYVIHNYQTKYYVGSEYFGEKADGVYLIFDVTIENIGKESETLWSTNLIIIDEQDRRFEHDYMAEIYIDDSFSFEQMQPGLPKRGKIIFDVPQDISGYLEISSTSIWSDDVVFVSWAD